MNVLDRIAREKQTLNNRLSELRKQKLAALRRTFLKCRACKKTSRLSNWVFLQTVWWVPPHGCTEGGYWRDEDVDTCFVGCPNCQANIYIYNDPQKDKLRKMAKSEFVFQDLFRKVQRIERNKIQNSII